MNHGFSIDEIADVYYLKSPSQLKVLAEPIRYRMCLLLTKPHSCAAVARSLKITRPKAHYHLKKLESVGLVRPYSEAVVNGIVEKYYLVIGRMLDFSHLVPRSNEVLPDNVSAEVVGAISDFLSSMLDVSRENALAAYESHALGKSYFFDFDSVMTRDQLDAIKAKMVALREEVIALSHQNLAGTQDGLDLVPFHMSAYISPKKDSTDA